MRVAIQNLHRLPQLFGPGAGINNYVLELIRRGHVQYLFYDDDTYIDAYGSHVDMDYKVLGIPEVEVLHTSGELNSSCDVLLNFNAARPVEFTPAVMSFHGMKVFHIMDWFWLSPATVRNSLLEEYGVHMLLSYSRSDEHCEFFRSSFPRFIGKTLGVPYGFSDRFAATTPLDARLDRCVALGSVNPLRYDHDPRVPRDNWVGPAQFFPEEAWFHKRRRQLLEAMDTLPFLDSKLPVFPRIKDFGYDLVAVFNKYAMFVTCESLFNFPPAKAYEGPACGCLMVCADVPCYEYFGFKSFENCVMYDGTVDDFRRTVVQLLAQPELVRALAWDGMQFVRKNYNHAAIADRLFSALSRAYAGGGVVEEWLEDWGVQV